MDGLVAQYWPIGSLVIFGIVSLVTVKVALAKRPTFEDANKRYKETKVCDEIHKSANEKLNCIPEIKDRVTRIETKIDIFLEKNGK